MKNSLLLATLTVLPLTSWSNWKPDFISLASGQFTSPFHDRHADISQYRLAFAWELTEPLWTSSHLVLQSYAELAIGQWRSHLSTGSGARVVNQASASPVLRVSGSSPFKGEIWPFFDFGIGASYQTEEDIEQRHPSGINMGGHWQFELRSMVGLGFGQEQSVAISYGWIHYSNAHLYSINEGMDFHTLQMSYRL